MNTAIGIILAALGLALWLNHRSHKRDARRVSMLLNDRRQMMFAECEQREWWLN